MSSQVQEIPYISFSGRPSFNRPCFQFLDLFPDLPDTGRTNCCTGRVGFPKMPVFAQIVDLLASFPKSGRTLKTELRVKVYDCFKFRCWNFSIRCSGPICSRVCRWVEADTTRTRSRTGRVGKSLSSSISLESCKIRVKAQQCHIL